MPAQKQGASKKPRKAAPPVQESTPASHVWMERALNLVARFTRFGWDLLGTLLVAFAVLTILALLGLTSGTLVSPLEWFLRHWLGWGSWLVPIIAALGGLLTFRRLWSNPSSIRYSRVFAFEGAVLSLLPLLAVTGGTSLERAESGLDGGVVGWGLAELPRAAGLPPLASTLIFGISSQVFPWHV